MNTFQHFRYAKNLGQSNLVAARSAVIPDLIQIVRPFVWTKNLKWWLNYVHGSFEGSLLLGLPWFLHFAADYRAHPLGTYKIFNQKPIMLFSGGLDSFIMWRLMGMPDIVYFSIGHRAQKKELDVIEYLIVKSGFRGSFHVDQRLKLREDTDTGYILFRNLLFILLAASYSKLIIINRMLEYAPDKNERFFRKTQKLMNLSGTGSSWHHLGKEKFKILTPFKFFTKTQLIKMYRRVFNDDLFMHTYSCYEGGDVHCGKCYGCVPRVIAMANNGVVEGYKNQLDLKAYASGIKLRDFKFRQIPQYIGRSFEILEFRKRMKHESNY